MSEHKEPIPSMIYNAAVGGHVTNSQQIIDENLNKEQSQINQEIDTFIKSKGNANGIATLDGLGKVPSSQLPSYVDDVIEGYYYGTEDPDTHEVTYDFYTDAEHTQKITPERGKIYLDVPTDTQYRWTGSVYSEISSSIAPDEEDLTNANGVIKFKNKAFSSQNYSGLGRIYLRKNIVNNVNTLTQSMMTQANTIYVIQYDFTLGEDITIPANCVLKFDGGSISGAYTITLNGTKIVGKECINSILAGTIYNSVVDADIFGSQISDLNILISCFNIAGTVYLKHNKTYNIGNNVLTLSKETYIFGNNAHIISSNKGIDTAYPLFIYDTKITADITPISLNKTETDGVSKAVIDGCALHSATVSTSPVTYAIGACCHDLTIRNCKLSGGYLTVGVQGDYYTIKAGSSFTFIGNEVSGTAADLLQINSFSKGLVSENKFIESVNNSIAVTESYNIDICNNEFYEFGTSDSHWGIALSYGADKCRVFGNYLTTSHNVAGGICSDLYRPNDEGKTLGYNVIQSNTIKFTVAGKNGVVLNGSDYSTVKDNYIENSTVRGVGANDSVHAIIENNVIVQKGGIPINITDSSSKTIVSHNDIRCTADSSCGTGININNSDGSVVSQNTIDWTSQASVQFMFTCGGSDCDFVGNVVNMRNRANGRVFAMSGKDSEVAYVFIYKNVFKSLSGGVHWLIEASGPMDIKFIGNIYQEPDASVIPILTHDTVTYSFNDYVNGAAYTTAS